MTRSVSALRHFPAVGGTVAGSAGPTAAAALHHGDPDVPPETIGGHQLRRDELIGDNTSRSHKVADTVERLLSDARKALSTDLDAATICLAQASVLLQAERRRQSRQSASRVGVSIARGGLAPWQILRVVAHIDSHLAERTKVSDFLELTGLSGSHFSRAFRASFGDSPHNFVVRRRIESAQKLMLETSEPLCEIALRCGLCDQAHLSRLFRQAVGMSPNAWRRRQQIEGQSDRAHESDAA